MSQDTLGLTEAKRSHPEIFNERSQVHFAQIEYLRDGKWAPAPAYTERNGGILETGVIQPLSGHANQVARVIIDNGPLFANYTAYEANAFVRNSLRAGFIHDPDIAWWDIENHSYGAANAMAMDAIDRMERRIQRDNILAVVGHPNASNEIAKPMYWRAEYVLVVGGTAKNFGWTTWKSKTPVPHIFGASADSSIACAEVSALAALAWEAWFRKHGIAPAYSDIRDLLISTARPGRLVAADRALDAILGTSTTISPPEPDPEPEIPVSDPEFDLSNGDEPPLPPEDDSPPITPPAEPEPVIPAAARYSILREALAKLPAEGEFLSVDELESVIAAVDAQRAQWAKEDQ